MAHKEKGRPAGGDSIPNDVLADKSEYTAIQIQLQVSRLIRTSGVSVTTAAVVS